MQVLLIYNPVSSNGVFKTYLDYVINQFQRKGMQIIPYRMCTVEKLDGMMSNLQPALFKKILIAGGDGTINQVVNAMQKYDIDIPISIFPVGTANDFAQYFNIPKTIEEMTNIALGDNYTYSDIGKVNDKYFVNVASLGFLIDISQKTDRKFKNNLGVMAYYLKGIEELPNLRPVYIEVKSEQLDFEGEVFFVLIMNGKSAGGFKKIAPFASMNDGRLDVFIFEKMPVIEIMPLMLRVVSGEHVDNLYVRYFQTDKLTINCDQPVGTDLDGEKGSEFPLDIKILQKRLRVNTLTNNEDGFPRERNLSFYDVKKAFNNISRGFIDEIKRPLIEFSGERSTVKDVGHLLKTLPRHNPISYVNKEAISEEYFKEAENCLDNGYIYLILSSTGSPAGEIIRKMTRKEYSHASLSFDEELRTITSYNGGENIFLPGLNQEMIEFFNQKPDANIVIYKIAATREQKEIVLNEIHRINEQGSSYNLLGVFRYSHKKNIMFCSQFVYTMLQVAGLAYFDKRPEEVRPMDFVELNHESKLEYCTKLFLNEQLG